MSQAEENERQEREKLLLTIESKPNIAERFTDLKRLGREGGGGAFSLLVTATDRNTGDRVAIKIFNPQKSGDRYRVESFRRESEILQRLAGQRGILQCVQPHSNFEETFRHPDFGIEIKIPFNFHVTELAYCDVASVIDEQKWSARETLVNFREMVKILRRVHKLGIMHRDVKPGNFLIMADGSMTLSDFGTARDLLTIPAILDFYQWPVGDLTYTPLEAIAALHDADPRFGFLADFYALGATLFELFTGVPLNIQLFSFEMLSELNQALTVVDKSNRQRIYDETISALTNKYTLPDIREFRTEIPAPIREGVNRLYQGLAALDYRVRLIDEESIYRQLDCCILILDNALAYKRWRQRREQFREAEEAKRVRLSARKNEFAQ
jgi:serine/threonine protein kinase